MVEVRGGASEVVCAWGKYIYELLGQLFTFNSSLLNLGGRKSWKIMVSCDNSEDGF